MKCVGIRGAGRYQHLPKRKPHTSFPRMTVEKVPFRPAGSWWMMQATQPRICRLQYVQASLPGRRGCQYRPSSLECRSGGLRLCGQRLRATESTIRLPDVHGSPPMPVPHPAMTRPGGTGEAKRFEQGVDTVKIHFSEQPDAMRIQRIQRNADGHCLAMAQLMGSRVLPACVQPNGRNQEAARNRTQTGHQRLRCAPDAAPRNERSSAPLRCR